MNLTDKEAQSLIDAREVLNKIAQSNSDGLHDNIIYVDSICTIVNLDDVLERIYPGWKEYIKDD